jgi:hypothetical protein
MTLFPKRIGVALLGICEICPIFTGGVTAGQ